MTAQRHPAAVATDRPRSLQLVAQPGSLPRPPRQLATPQRGRPSLLSELSWLPLCHELIRRKERHPTCSWSALAAGRGIHPRTLYNWRLAYEQLARDDPERLRQHLKGTPP